MRCAAKFLRTLLKFGLFLCISGLFHHELPSLLLISASVPPIQALILRCGLIWRLVGALSCSLHMKRLLHFVEAIKYLSPVREFA